MSSYISLCQKAEERCGVTGGGPSTVIGQTGEHKRFVGWVAEAYENIQLDRNWKWLRKKFTLQTVAGTDTYDYTDCTDVEDAATISRFKSWYLSDQRNPPKLYLTSVGVGGETLLTWSSWDNFEYLYKTGTIQSVTSRPVHISVDPDLNIRLGQSPDDIYTITGDYYRSPLSLSFDSEVPDMPASYHDLIVYEAMLLYSDYESAPEVERRATRGIRRMLPPLRKNQGPDIRTGTSLA